MYRRSTGCQRLSGLVRSSRHFMTASASSSAGSISFAVVTGIFVTVQQVDGLFVTPKIVGESVGLHPVTVIVSVFVWSLLMGGLLGAILAVPMTATIKVLLKRYVWERRFRQDAGLPTEESFAVEQARILETPE